MVHQCTGRDAGGLLRTFVAAALASTVSAGVVPPPADVAELDALINAEVPDVRAQL
eukprot:SAG31_NODE_18134_length_645_cov_2.186813_1_plen_56_part_00